MSLTHIKVDNTEGSGAIMSGISPAISATRFWKILQHLLQTQGRAKGIYAVVIAMENQAQGDTYLIEESRMNEYFENSSIRHVMINPDPENPNDFHLSFSRNFNDNSSRWGITGYGANRVLPGLLIREVTEEVAFSFGVVRDGLYSGWQSCSRPDAYQRQYGSTEGFRFIADLPPPLSSIQRLDISKNPGSGRTISGETFVIAAEMWLGPHFWQYAKCTKEEAMAADFFIEKRDTPHFLYLKCWPEPFTRPDGEQGRMQQRLWKLFFQEDCEWPPGSGSICDEPMFGPPELMPDYNGPKKS
jgi:hypothetical protein